MVPTSGTGVKGSGYTTVPPNLTTISLHAAKRKCLFALGSSWRHVYNKLFTSPCCSIATYSNLKCNLLQIHGMSQKFTEHYSICFSTDFAGPTVVPWLRLRIVPDFSQQFRLRCWEFLRNLRTKAGEWCRMVSYGVAWCHWQQMKLGNGGFPAMVSPGASKSECVATAFACSLPRPGIVSLGPFLRVFALSLISSNSNELEMPVATPVLWLLVSTCSGRYVVM